MSLKTLFGGKDTAVDVYRRELMQAVKDGDIDKLQVLIKSNIDAPPDVLNDPLARAVSKDQLRLAKVLLDAPGTRTIDAVTLRAVVYNERTDMFRLLSDAGFKFAEYVPSESGASYVTALRYMNKDYECAKLRAALEAAKEEMTALRKLAGLPEPTEAPEPRRFSL